MAAAALLHENVWVDRYRVEDAEYAYHQALANQRAGLVVQTNATNHCSGGGDSHSSGSDLIINEIARARQNIKKSLDNDGVGLKIGVGVDSPEIQARLSAVEQENKDLKSITAILQKTVAELTARVTTLEKGSGGAAPADAPAADKKAAPADDDEDDDFDLFGDDDEDEEEAAKLAEERKAANAPKKKKPVLIAKSSIVLDVKPWDDETDMAEIEAHCRAIEADGLRWGASKLVEIGYGIKKLQIIATVEDDKVGTDFLEERITANEDLVQSMDIFAFNKI